MGRAAIPTIVTTGSACEAESHAVVIRLSRAVRARIARLGREVARRHIRHISISVNATVYEGGIEDADWALTDPTAVQGWLEANANANPVRARDIELVIGGQDWWWIRYTVKHLESTLWTTPGMTIASLLETPDAPEHAVAA